MVRDDRMFGDIPSESGTFVFLFTPIAAITSTLGGGNGTKLREIDWVASVVDHILMQWLSRHTHCDQLFKVAYVRRSLLILVKPRPHIEKRNMWGSF